MKRNRSSVRFDLVGIKSQKLVQNIDFRIENLLSDAVDGQCAVMAAEPVILVKFAVAVRAVQTVFFQGTVYMGIGKLFDNACPPG